MGQLQGKNVLITGGASGIGKILGRLVLERGAKLVIWDINQEKINETIFEFKAKGEVKGYQVDVSDLQQIKQSDALVKKEIGYVDILINNAGIVVGKHFSEHSCEDVVRTMAINAHAPMLITLEFLQDMLERNSGHIVNMASLAGLISNPKMSVYAASKWSVIGWSDSLRLEMQLLNKNINITTVAPYYMSTGMFDGVKSIIPIIHPEKMALKIIRAIEKNKTFISSPFGYRTVRAIQGVLGIRGFDYVVGKGLRIYSTMDEFTGHKK